MFDPEQFETRAASLEYCAARSRYQAEAEAAAEQGVARWKALQEVENAKRSGNFGQGGNIGQAAIGDGSGALPGVQHDAAQQAGPMPVSDIHGGRGGLEVLALHVSGGQLL